MLQEVRANSLEINGMIESLGKEIEDIKKNQMEILELKNTITQTEKQIGSTSEWRDRGKNQ